MATLYPGALDTLTNPAAGNPLNSPSHADQHINANDAIEAIEATLGVNPHGYSASVAARLINKNADGWTPGITQVGFYLQGATWSESLRLFVAVGSTDPEGDAYIATSPDGLTWTSRTVPSDVAFLTKVAWSPSLTRFCAVGIDDTDDPITVTSSDGVTWTRHAVGAAASPAIYYDIVWASSLNLFVIVGKNGTSSAATSPDGQTWTLRTTPAFANGSDEWIVIAWSGTTLCATGRRTNTDGARAITSTDGITWTLRTIVAGSNNHVMRGIAWSTLVSKFLAVGEDTTAGDGVLFNSSDGITWVDPYTDPWPHGEFRSLGCNNHVFYAATETNTAIWVTRDGKSWVKRAEGAQQDFIGFANNSQVIIAVGEESPWISER